MACTPTGGTDAGPTPTDAATNIPDAAGGADAAGTPDAAVGRDAAVVSDAAIPRDAALPPDAATSFDAAVTPDAAMAPDGAVTPDGGAPGDGGPLLDGAVPDAASGDAGVDAGQPPTMVAVNLTGSVLLGNNYPAQLHDLFAATFTAGSGMGRLRLFARFCADAACDVPLALEQATVQGADAMGYYVYVTAGVTGQGFAKDFSIARAPLGASFVQLIGDTQASATMGKGQCSSLLDCPGDVDVIQAASFEIAQNVDGNRTNPVPGSVPLNVTSAGQTVALGGPHYLGHIIFKDDALIAPAPSDPGRLLVAASNMDNTFRNELSILNLDALGSVPSPSSRNRLQKNGMDFPGDICGAVRGGSTLYVVGVDNSGANVFAINATTGLQQSDVPIVVIAPNNPNDATTFPWPCRGVFATVGGKEHLYLIQFAGAGSLNTSRPSALYHVNITDRAASPCPSGCDPGPGTALTDYALRALVLDAPNNRLVAVDMSWSLDSVTRGVDENRLVIFPLNTTTGAPEMPTFSLTGTTSDEPCDSTANYPSGLSLTTLGATRALLLGHDTGVAVLDASTLTQLQDLDLGDFGRLFTQVSPTPDGTRLLALPQCKALTARSRFTLPYGPGTEPSDNNLVAILTDTNGMLAVASTTIDVDGNATLDHGVDLDAWHVKSYIRGYDSTLPIPPVVFTGPAMAVGRTMLFVRGSGIQGNGTAVLSSSGLGQAQDVSVHSLITGRPIIFNGYQPFWDGLSSMAGTGAAIWGVDLYPGQESSVGLVEYLP